MIKKSVVLALIFILVIPFSILAKEKRGAELIVNMKDGQSVRGELITVKENSLLLQEQRSGADVTVEIEDVVVIEIVKKSKLVPGAGLGLLVGWGSGALIGAALEEKNDMVHTSLIGGGGESINWFSDLALIGSAIGLVIGGIVGVGAGKDKTMRIDGKSDSEIQKIMEDLRSKARIPDYQ